MLPTPLLEIIFHLETCITNLLKTTQKIVVYLIMVNGLRRPGGGKVQLIMNLKDKGDCGRSENIKKRKLHFSKER